MNVKTRLTIMNFFQFFVWGAWLITIANYYLDTKHYPVEGFGAIFSTLGLSSIIMPALVGIVADRWINAEKLYGCLHILYGLVFLFIPQAKNANEMFFLVLLGMIFYMPTISLSNSIAYNILKKNNYDLIKEFPPIRIWGTIGFIVAMWVTNLSGSKANANQFYIAAAGAILLGVYSFTFPPCPPERSSKAQNSWTAVLGLDAFKLFTNYRMALFFIFSMFLGAALQLTNMYGDRFLSSFDQIPEFANSFGVRYSTLIISISQISETLFILAIPFFLKRFGIKRVMLMSMFAWVLRFGFFAFGDPAGGLWMIILSCLIYGMAFDFFNVSGSLYVEMNTNTKIRSSAQGLFMMMCNGFGAVFGSLSSGYLIHRYFETTDGNLEWKGIWLTFASYALLIAVLFALMFKYKHKTETN